MVVEAPSAARDLPEAGSAPVPDAEALIEEARRARRKRYRRYAITLAVVALVGVVAVLLAVGDLGGAGGSRSPGPSSRPPPAPAPPPSQTVPAGTGVVGQGPTAIDFSDVDHGWIASGSLRFPTGNPTIVRTTDGGLTWQRTPVPNLAVQDVDPQTRYAFGGLVGIHFSDAVRGWFFQAGIGWQTNDAGTRWTRMHLPVEGALVALTSSGSDVWALVDGCPTSAVSCSRANAKGLVFRATSAQTLRWSRVGGPVPTGFGALYPSAGHAVVVALGPDNYRRSVGSGPGGEPTTGCVTVGPLGGEELAGVCAVGGAGDASVTNIAISHDQGTTWEPLIGGPPSSQYEGPLTTDGTGAVFYVTGGQTLWRTSTSNQGWRAVLETAAGSTDDIDPVYVAGTHGYALLSGGLDAHWFETHNGGVSWEPATLP